MRSTTVGGGPEGKWVSGVKGGDSDLAGLLLGWAAKAPGSLLKLVQEGPPQAVRWAETQRSMGVPSAPKLTLSSGCHEQGEAWERVTAA